MDKNWRAAKNEFLAMPLEQKRKHYQCGNQLWTLDKMRTWKNLTVLAENHEDPKFPINNEVNDIVSLIRHDITAVEVDVIVNAANSSLRGGGGVDGAIHRAAGPWLTEECKPFEYCPAGQARITGAYRLPAKYIVHAVGPVGEYPDLLRNCYLNSIQLALDHNCRTIVFPCISTGVFGYPREAAARVALRTVRFFLENYNHNFSRVIFCCFLKDDAAIYERLMQVYFPRPVTCPDDNDSS